MVMTVVLMSRELYLQNNRLAMISSDAFANLASLQVTAVCKRLALMLNTLSGKKRIIYLKGQSCERSFGGIQIIVKRSNHV